MNLIIWFGLFFLVAIIQFLVIPLHLGLILVAWIGLSEDERVSFWLVFVAGLITDLFLGRDLGGSSLFFLWFTFIMKILSRRLRPAPLVLAGLITVTQLVYGLIFFHVWSWKTSILLGGISGLIFHLWPPQTKGLAKPILALD